MAEFAALPLFTDSWLADTGHLTRAERGLYMDMLILCWRSPECRMPNEIAWVARRLNVQTDELPTLKKLVEEFMTSSGNWLTQKRLRKEFKYTREKTKKMSDMAKSRWNKEKDTSLGNATQHNSSIAAQHAFSNAPSPSPSPSPTNQQQQIGVNGHAVALHDVERILRAIPGLDAHPVVTAPVIAPILALIDAGWDLERMIVPSIKQALGRTKKPIATWAYFAKILREEGKPVSAPPPPKAEQISDERWQKRMKFAREKRVWDYANQGPLPHTPGCRVPSHLLEPSDGKGWIDFKDYRP